MGSRTLLSSLLGLALLAPACGKSDAPPAGVSPSTTAGAATARASSKKDPTTAKAWIAAGATVIDVRTPDEFKDEHLPQATNIPVGEFAGRLAEVDKLVGGDHGKQVVVYCAAGSRAAQAKAQLDAAGYTNVVNGGGYDDVR